jgi:hypothetical protein
MFRQFISSVLLLHILVSTKQAYPCGDSHLAINFTIATSCPTYVSINFTGGRCHAEFHGNTWTSREPEQYQAVFLVVK